MGQTLEPRASASGPVYFELERLEQTVAGRLELSGRWFGVRGRRFVRPTLTFEAEGQRYRLLADLEHKPWLAEDGSPWTAAFAWQADAGPLEGLELSVAPDIVIPLSEGDGGDRPETKRPGPSASDRAAALRRQLQQVTQELADERKAGGRLREEVEALRVELDTAGGERERIRDEKVRADAAMARQEAALARLSRLEGELDDERRSLEQAERQRDELRRAHRQVQAERDRALDAVEQLRAELQIAGQSHDKALAEREHALRTRDQALSERNQALAERDEFARADDSLQSQRAAARALVRRHNLAWPGSPGSPPGAHLDIRRRDIRWRAPIAAVILAVVVVVVVLLILGVL